MNKIGFLRSWNLCIFPFAVGIGYNSKCSSRTGHSTVKIGFYHLYSNQWNLTQTSTSFTKTPMNKQEKPSSCTLTTP